MSIKQMQASYRAEQDRIFLTLSTHEHESLRFILTRKVCKATLESMDELFGQEMLLGVSATTIPSTPPSAQSEKLLKQFSVQAKYPLGESYVLITGCEIVLESQTEMVQLTLDCVDTKTIELHMDLATLNDLLALLWQTIEESDWGLIDVASRDKFIHNSGNAVKFLH